MRILFISPRQSLPPTSGAKLRDYHLARALGRRDSLTYVHYVDAPPALNYLDLGAERIVAIPRPPGYTPAKILRGLVGPWPISVENYLCPSMSSAIGSLTGATAFDLVHLDALQLAGYEPLLAGASLRVVYDWHNIESELMKRFGKNDRSPFKRLYAEFTARRLERLEKRIMHSAFGHLVCSEREREQLLRIAPNARVAVIPNGVDTHFYDTLPVSGVRNRLLFVGSMSYYANIDAITRFAREVWPSLRSRFPLLRLTLVGSNPGPGIQSLAALDGVEVTGTVDDIRPFYAQALAAIVPLNFGGGTRLKILEAMAARVPVISTPLGAEGLDLTSGRDILLVSTNQDWDNAISTLLQGDTAGAMMTAGRQITEKHYDWTMLGEQLHNLYERWLNERS